MHTRIAYLPLHDALGARVVLVQEEERLVPVLHGGLAQPHDVGVLYMTSVWKRVSVRARAKRGTG